MSDRKSDQLREKIDDFAEKYKLWYVIPLVISGLLALSNVIAGFSVLLFFVGILIFLWVIGKILSFFMMLLPTSLSQDQRKAVHEAGGATLFLGGCAIIGIVLRNDNFLSDWLKEQAPVGMSIGFIDPTFAVIVLLCIWVYTGYRMSR